MIVIGVGNRLRGDDAAGLAAAELLRARGLNVVLREGGLLIDDWAGHDALVLIDAVSSGAAPGTIHLFDVAAAPLPAAFARSTHGLGVAESLELARALGRLPPRAHVYGIEGERFGPADPLSPAVAAAVERLAEAIIQSGCFVASRP